MKLALRQTQRVVMTPLLQQAIQLLQLSTLELEQVVRKELEENPLLEELPVDGAEGPAPASPDAAAEPPPTPPPAEPMKDVFAHLYEACRDAGLPIGILPIEVSLVVQPEEAADLASPRLSSSLYEWKLSAFRALARPYVLWKCRTPGTAAGRV